MGIQQLVFIHSAAPLPVFTTRRSVCCASVRIPTATDNTACGHNALFSNRFADYNTAVGESASSSNTVGDENTAVGWLAMYRNTTGVSNTAVGESALHRNTEGGEQHGHRFLKRLLS